MRRFFSNLSIALVLFTCVAGIAPATHAAKFCFGSENNLVCPSGEKCINNECVSETPSNAVGAVTGGTESTTNKTGTEKAQVSSAPAAKNGDGNTPLSFEGGEAFAPVTTFIMSIFAWLLGVAMVVLDSAVYYTVVKMGSYINNLSAVGVTWRILRDIGNITLIFGFLAVGITTILNVDWYGGKKTLPMLIIVAVLLNFSLFISEAIIDSGNLFATQFYSQINGGHAAGTSTSFSNEPISSAIMNKLGLATLYGSALRKDDFLKENNIIFISIFGSLLFMVAAFVMFSLAFILIVRFVALLFLIIIAPLGFAGLAVPQLKGTAEKWWSELIKQTITAPALLLLLYVALRIITDSHFLVGDKDPDVMGFLLDKKGELNINGYASFILSFIVAMGALLSVTVFAKKLGAFGADVATKWGGRLSFGLTAMGMSAVTGGVTRFARNRVQNLTPTSTAGRWAQRLTSRTLRAAESGRMDIRSAPLVGGYVSAGLKFAGAGEAANPVEHSTFDRAGQAVHWVEHSGDAANRQFDQETRLPRLQAAIVANDAAATRGILGNISNQDLESSGIRRLLVNSPLAAALLPQNRFDALMQSENLSDAEKLQLRTQRAADPRFNPANASASLNGMTTDQRSQLDGSILVRPHVMSLLDAADFNAIQRRGQLTQSQRTAMGAYILSILRSSWALTQQQTNLRAGLTITAAAPAFRSYFNLP